MALNIKNPEVERLAAEASRLTGESKTESIRKALEERVARLRLRVVKRDREADVLRYLEREVWPSRAEARPGTGASPAARRIASWATGQEGV